MRRLVFGRGVFISAPQTCTDENAEKRARIQGFADEARRRENGPSQSAKTLRSCQDFTKSVIIEGFADRSGDGKRRRRSLKRAAGRSCRIIKNIQPISVGV